MRHINLFGHELIRYTSFLEVEVNYQSLIKIEENQLNHDVQSASMVS
jgi:hypothetical protein